jgi:demethylmenaquinone methyltransferase/2-methoxy-6-polyprenyl-1,4-benzoquinol methylase
MSQEETTHFGFEQVRASEKATRVRGVFDSVAQQYDVMNDVMSFGLHRLWKHFAVGVCGLRGGESVLDLAAGTGDLSARMLPTVGPEGQIVMSDINHAMLSRGRMRMEDEGHVRALNFAQINAEALPFADAQFDVVTIGFGLRNVTDKDQALREMHRVLKPGGRAVILEFSKPIVPGLDKIYDLYSFKLLPLMGKFVAKDADSYRYLAESIRMHPDQQTLRDMLTHAGFAKAEVFNLSGGIVAVHRGTKI